MTIILDIETTGLDPTTDKLTCVGALIDREGLNTWQIRQNWGTDERNMITLIALLLEHDAGTIEPERIITFNGQSFDIPFLRERAKIAYHDDRDRAAQVDTTFAAYLAKGGPHLDLMQIAMNTPELKKYMASTGRISKDGLAKLFDLYVPSSMTGAACALAGEDAARGMEPRLDRVAQHNATDLFVTWRIWQEFRRRRWDDVRL